MLIEDGAGRGFVPYPAPTSAERARWAAQRAEREPEARALAIRARDAWYAGGYDITARQARHLDEGSLINLAENQPADLTTTPDLIGALKGTQTDELQVRNEAGASIGAERTDDPRSDGQGRAARHPRDRASTGRRARDSDHRHPLRNARSAGRMKPKPPILAAVIADLEAEIARLTEAKRKLEKI